MLRKALLAKSCLFPQGAQSFGEKQGFLGAFGHPRGFLDLPVDNTIVSGSDFFDSPSDNTNLSVSAADSSTSAG